MALPRKLAVPRRAMEKGEESRFVVQTGMKEDRTWRESKFRCQRVQTRGAVEIRAREGRKRRSVLCYKRGGEIIKKHFFASEKDVVWL